MSRIETKEYHKKICKNCYGHNYLIECECSEECHELIFMIGGNGLIRHYKKGHYLKNRIGDKTPGWRGGIGYYGEYLKIYRPDHRFRNIDNCIMLHRHVYEYFHKCCLLPHIEIHHINGIKTDNHRHNLMAITKFNHLSMHKRGNKNNKKDMSNRKCLICDIDKTSITKKGHTKWHKYQNGYICHKCYMGIYNENKKMASN